MPDSIAKNSDDKKTTTKAASSNDTENTQTALEDQRWLEQLSRPVLQSINYYSEPINIGKAQRKDVHSWIAAGISEDNLDKFSSFASKKGVISHKSQPSPEGFGMKELQLMSFKPSSKKTFKKLRNRAERLGLELWQEVKHEDISNGSINPNTITEGTFDLNINDVEPATDVNGDGIADPMFHLLASDVENASFGVNAVGGWSIASGEGVRVGIVDSPHDLLHTDLNANLPVNFDLDGDGNLEIDANGNSIPDILDNDHSGTSAADHGTAVSGIALGRHNNGSAVGVAPESTYVPHRYLRGGVMPDSGYYNYADVVNNSWGSRNGTSGVFLTRSPLFLATWETATQNSIQVIAAGNDRGALTQGWNNTNNDGRTRRENIIVGATMRNGEVEQYSTPGASVFVSAPVNGSNFRFINALNSGPNANQQFTTTSDVTDDPSNNSDDVGYANGPVTTRMNGTSAAAPMVTGSIAMMLEVNPSLTVRDVQHILTETSIKNGLIDSNADGEPDAINPNAGGDAAVPGSAGSIELRTTFQAGVNTTFGIADGHNTGWFQNGAGHWVSDSFGFGIVDAGAAVQAANNWTNVSDELKATTNTILSNPFTIPEGNLGDLDSLSQAGSWKVQDPLKVEWVELTLDLNLPEQDEVMLAVQSPSGTRSVLMAPGGSDAAGFNSERTLITNQFWGEPSSGEWSVEVLDTRVDGDNATISNAKLDIYGTCDQQSPLKVTPFDEHAINGFGLDKLADKFLADGGAKSHHYELIEVIPRGKSKSFGTFKSGLASGLKIDQGTIYTTGHSKDAIGPNSRPNTTTNWQAQGTPLLGDNNKDASGFEIRFKAKRDMSLGWKVQFGSEEFDEWSPSIYDDRAGIFLSTISGKKGSQPVNLLRSPDDMDFSVNGFSSKGVFEKRISINEPCGPVTWEYDGVTGEAIESQKANLVKGKSYSITPIIADMVDPYYDSGMVIGSIKKISKTSSFPNFTSFNKNDFQDFRWKKYDISKLSDKKANSVNWNKVDLSSTSGKTSFDYANANWESIIDSEGFGKQAAKNLSLELLPDRQLSETSINKLLQLNPALKASDFI